MDSPFSQINSYMQKLPRSSGKLDGLLIGRLVVSALLLAAVQFMDLLPGLKISIEKALGSGNGARVVEIDAQLEDLEKELLRRA